MAISRLTAIVALATGGLAGEIITLSTQHASRVLMKSESGYMINWSTAFDHVAVYGRDGKQRISYYPSAAGLTFHRIGDAAIQPDGGFVLAGTLTGLVGALVFVDRDGATADVVRVHPGYLGKIARSSDGRIWAVGRSPNAGDSNSILVFTSKGQLESTSLDSKELPVPSNQLQLGATFLTAWRDSAVWALPEHGLIFVLSRNGEIQKRIRIAPSGGDVTGAWTRGDKVLLGVAAEGGRTARVVEVDVATGEMGEGALPEGGHPIGVFQGGLVRYSHGKGTVAFEPWGLP